MKMIDMAHDWGHASRIKQATKSTEEYTCVQERMLASVMPLSATCRRLARASAGGERR